MAFVKAICISAATGGETVVVDAVDAIAGQGLKGDRYLGVTTSPLRQLTLIESELIDQFNHDTKSVVPYQAFRRNVITKGIKLNNLVGVVFCIGEVTVLGTELCEPCRPLQERLGIPSLVKRLAHKGGLCCKIMSGGTIRTKDKVYVDGEYAAG